MRFFKLIICISLFMTTLLCNPSFIYAKAVEINKHTFPLDRQGKVYLENVSGDIVINTWDKNEIEITARTVALKKKDLDNVSIDISQTDSNIRIITRHRKSYIWSQPTNTSVHYMLYIPDKAQIRIKSISGSVEAQRIGGFLDIETTSGNVEVKTAKNDVKTRTISGAIYFENLAGDADLGSTSGGIRVKGIKGSVEANTVTGDINLNNISLSDEIEVVSIQGNIEMDGELSQGGIYEFDTIIGGIEITLPPASDFELLTKTVNGKIDCDFELTTTEKSKKGKKRGVVGKGSASLEISSVSGSISIVKRK